MNFLTRAKQRKTWGHKHQSEGTRDVFKWCLSRTQFCRDETRKIGKRKKERGKKYRENEKRKSSYVAVVDKPGTEPFQNPGDVVGVRRATDLVVADLCRFAAVEDRGEENSDRALLQILHFSVQHRHTEYHSIWRTWMGAKLSIHEFCVYILLMSLEFSSVLSVRRR